MKPTIEVYIGSPVSGDEAHFLARLFTDLSGLDALILANFEISKGSKSRQIDFIAITNTHAQLLEQKTLRGPIIGADNGPWKLTNTAGHLVTYPGENPWVQASQAKYLLSDLMLAFSQKASGIPSPLNKAFYREFDASVCIYPQLDPGSEVTKGNFKAFVRAYSDCLSAIKVQTIPSNWRIPEWRRFATEALGLRSVTLKQAIDHGTLAASDLLGDYRKQLANSLRSLPPIRVTEDEDYGERLLERLLRPENILLLGPTGCGKSFHLKHLLNLLASRDEVPVFVQARHYSTAGITNLIQRSVAVHYRGPVKEFLETCQLAGQRIALVVDAMNECPAILLGDLRDELKAFVAQSQGRLVVSGHDPDDAPSDAIKTTLTMRPLTSQQKRLIYAYYAGTNKDVDHLCAGFTNAYDLTLAGKCHQASAESISRVSLYERYCRKNLPKETEALCFGFLRAFAATLENSLSFSTSRDEFDRLAERYLGTDGEALTVLDKVLASHLLEVNDDCVSFEHELLFIYFRAEHLRRVCAGIDELETALRRPIHRGLFEFILPRFTNRGEISRLLWSCPSADVIETALWGGCGNLVRGVVEDECSAAIEAAEADLQNIKLVPQQIQREDGRRFVAHVSVEGNRNWTSFELLLFTALFKRLSDKAWRDKLVELYLLTEQTLQRQARESAGREQLKFKAVWRETIRCLGHLSGHRELPALQLVQRTKMYDLFSREPQLAETILSKVYSELQIEPEREFSLLLLIYVTQELCSVRPTVDVNVSRCIELLRLSFSHASWLTRIDVLHLFRALEWHSVREDLELRAKIRAELQKLDTSNPVVNTDLIEILGIYEGIEPIVSAGQAEREFRRLLCPDAEFEEEIAGRCALRPEYSREEVLAEFAYSAISNIFEDVYSGVYGEAYESLSPEEKTKVLCMAGATRDGHGISTNWILAELSRKHDPHSVPIFLRYARKLQNNGMPYEVATAYLISVMACAKFMDEPPEYQEAVTPNELAWSIVGQILFWHIRLGLDGPRAADQIKNLWATARGIAAPAIPDVLRHLADGMWFELGDRKTPNLAELYKEDVRAVLEEAVIRREEVCSLIGAFSQQRKEIAQFTVQTLGKIGNEASILLLQQLIDDPELGKDAVDAIFQIRRRKVETR